MTRILGVDPGQGGALALLATEGDTIAVHDMPVVALKSGSEISEAMLADLVRELKPDLCWIERVHSMPRQGVASSFKFGLAYGLVRGVVSALGVPVHLVTPNEWKREFRLSVDKQQARVLAARMFPGQAKLFSRVRDDGRAEAALIAVFGGRYPL
jgi:crossover junction endodeoxyribonuclease RuvC